MFVGKVHSFEQRAVDIKRVRQSSLLSFEHNLNANICKLSPTSHGNLNVAHQLVVGEVFVCVKSSSATGHESVHQMLSVLYH